MPKKLRSTTLLTLWLLKEIVFAQRPPSGYDQEWRKTLTVKLPSLWTIQTFHSKSRSSHARRILSLAGRQAVAFNNSQRWNWRLFSLEEVKIRSSSRSETKSTLSRSQKYWENKPTLEDSAFPVGANARLISQNKFSFARDLLILCYQCCKCDKYLSIKSPPGVDFCSRWDFICDPVI